MNLLKSVERFAFDTFTDPYSVGADIKGRLLVFDDEKSSGVSTRRRVLETPPSYAMYSTACVYHNGTVYIVGAASYDRHRDVTIRVKYPVIPCDLTYTIASIKELLSGTQTAVLTYAFLDMSRNAVADSETSFPASILSAIMPAYENISKGKILYSGDNYYRVRSHGIIDGAGFLVAEVNLLDNPIQSMDFVQQSGYDPITEAMVAGPTYADRATLVESAYYNYDHTSERYAELKPGDKVISAVLPVVPKAGDTFDSYRVLSVEAIDTSTYSCHCRP